MRHLLTKFFGFTPPPPVSPKTGVSLTLGSSALKFAAIFAFTFLVFAFPAQAGKHRMVAQAAAVCATVPQPPTWHGYNVFEFQVPEGGAYIRLYVSQLAPGHDSYVIDWDDGTVVQTTAEYPNHTYKNAGTYIALVSNGAYDVHTHHWGGDQSTNTLTAVYNISTYRCGGYLCGGTSGYITSRIGDIESYVIDEQFLRSNQNTKFVGNMPNVTDIGMSFCKDSNVQEFGGFSGKLKYAQHGILNNCAFTGGIDVSYVEDTLDPEVDDGGFTVSWTNCKFIKGLDKYCNTLDPTIWLNSNQVFRNNSNLEYIGKLESITNCYGNRYFYYAGTNAVVKVDPDGNEYQCVFDFGKRTIAEMRAIPYAYSAIANGSYCKYKIVCSDGYVLGGKDYYYADGYTQVDYEPETPPKPDGRYPWFKRRNHRWTLRPYE